MAKIRLISTQTAEILFSCAGGGDGDFQIGAKSAPASGRDGVCGRAWVGEDQALAWCGEWCDLPNPDCRLFAIYACYAYQTSANTKQKRSLT